MKTKIVLTSLLVALASCGGERRSTSFAESTSQSAAQSFQQSEASSKTATAMKIQSIDAPADGATVCGPVVLSVTGADIGNLELLPESGTATLGRFVRDTNANKWVLTFDPDTIAQDSVVMVQIAGSTVSEPQNQIEVMRRHWLNVESCPAAV
jgi:hypothetical protein